MNWSRLASQLEGNLVLPDAPTYDLLRQPFNQRVNPFPAAVARCVSESDVVACVRFATQNDLAVTCRSGGHGAEGYCSLDGALMIDQSAMQEIQLDTEQGVVRVGAGSSWGQVDIATYPRRLASPGGGCAAVGVGGLSQGGGFGPIARTWGLTVDNVVSARIVTSRDERVIVADANHNEDLFWALRGGGGGNFGAVTQFTYTLRPIESQLLGGMLVYAWKDAAQVFSFYRDWMNGDNDERLTLLPMFFLAPGNQPLAGISAFYNGDAGAGLDYVEAILEAAGMPDPVGPPVDQALARGTLPAYTGTESTTAWPGSGQYWRSGYLSNDFPDAAIATFLEWFSSCPLPAGRATRPGAALQKQDDLSFGFIESLGGAIGRVGKTDTAFYWRDQLFSFTFIGIYDPTDTAWGERTHQWADGFRSAMEPYLSGGVYVNYMQSELSDWQHAYYGDNYEPLRAIKRQVDPGHVFCFPQDLDQ